MITIPVYDIVLLPDVSFYFRKENHSRWNLSEAEVGDEVLFLMMKENKDVKLLTEDDIYPVGFAAKVSTMDGDGNVQMKVLDRVLVSDIENINGEILATASVYPEKEDIPKEEAQERFERIRTDYLEFISHFQWGVWVRNLVTHWDTLEDMLCATAPYLAMDMAEKYKLMSFESKRARYDHAEQVLYEFFEGTKVVDRAKKSQEADHEKAYREAALKKQISFLQKELDSMHPENVSDVRAFEQKIEASGMNEIARKEADKVLNRMKQEGKDGHEYGMLYDYLDFVTSLSWKKEPMPEVDLARAEEILDEDHYGLKKVKERIIQQLAVIALNKKQSGSILLFVGAPGTGKTSFGQGIARALGREFVRVSLGGVRDEAEIRGHRRTYIGAMPGRIMEGVKRSKVSNPVIVLDEVDKLAREYHGDPASALLEVLDPEQNSNFTDHYMNVPYDLSDVLFVCTANSMDSIPEPLLNRMEVIQFPGYTAVEKFYIAKKHLLPKAMENAGMKAKTLRISDEVIRKIIAEYTMESGVRGLKKQLDNLCRSAAVKLVRGEKKSVTVSEKKLTDFLGRPNLHHEKKMEEGIPGTVTGLAWTSAGGEILFIETRLIPGDGKTVVTGKLGDVMKESVQIAYSLAKSLYPEEAKKFREYDLHIHVPAGAVPKDGPSAGITMTTALVSLLTGKAVSPELAMTGEISLRGTVLPIGGLPEKLMAAQRSGLTRILIPAGNVEDLEEVSEEVKSQLEILPVKTIEEVLKYAGLK